MSQPLVRADNPYSIFRLPEALTCWPAVSVMAASFLVAALVFALGGALARVWMGFTVLLALVAIVVGLAGISGAGACLSDLARKRPYRGLVGYFIAGLLCLPKLLGGGLVLLAALALRRPQPRALGFSIIGVIAFYAVAKALELADAPVFALTQQLISGHSAKHLVAALAGWPVVRALQSLARGAPAGHAARTIR